jgi:RecA/RadA recombinase
MQAPPPNLAPIPLNSISNDKCTLGCPILDSALRGGIPCGSITELVGECGSGKTQLCLQLLLCAQLPVSKGGLGSSSIYIHSEGYFASRRLQQLAQAFLRNGGFNPMTRKSFTRAEPELGQSGAQPKLGSPRISESQAELGQSSINEAVRTENELANIGPQPNWVQSLIREPNGAQLQLGHSSMNQSFGAGAQIELGQVQANQYIEVQPELGHHGLQANRKLRTQPQIENFGVQTNRKVRIQSDLDSIGIQANQKMRIQSQLDNIAAQSNKKTRIQSEMENIGAQSNQKIRIQSELDNIGVLPGFGQLPAPESIGALPDIGQSNGALHDEAQPMLGQYSINQSIDTHAELRPESGCDWNNDFIAVQINLAHNEARVGSDQHSIYRSESGQLPINGGLRQTNVCATAASSVCSKEKCFSQQKIGKRKGTECLNTNANEKRICCPSDLDDNQENDFWGAINSTEWEVLDSITNPRVNKTTSDAVISNSNDISVMVESDPCDNVFVQSVHTIEELLNFLDQTEVLLSRPPGMPVRLVVIDSVAALFRSDFDNTAKDLMKRASLFFKLSSKLKCFAHKFNLAVVVTNQVVDCIDSEGSKGPVNDLQLGNFTSLVSSGRRVLPALGLSWSHCINIRLFLSRTEEPTGFFDHACNSSDKTLNDSSSVTPLDESSRNTTVKRKLLVVYAPHLPRISCDFVIERDGMRGISY